MAAADQKPRSALGRRGLPVWSGRRPSLTLVYCGRLLVVVASLLILRGPVGQSPHARHPHIARRATVSHMRALVLSGKSGRSYPTFRALQEGRSRSSRYVGCGMRWPRQRQALCARRLTMWRTMKSCGPDIPTLISNSRRAPRHRFAMRGHGADDGGQKARCTEEITYKS